MPTSRARAAVWLLAAALASFVGAGHVAAAGDQRVVVAARAHDVAAVRTLIKQGADVNGRQADGATALHWAAHWDDGEMADLLIGAGADVRAANDLRITPLLLACTDGSAAIVERLLQSGANPHDALSTGATALMLAAYRGNAGAVRALLAKGAAVNASEPVRGQTALMWAAANRHEDAVQALLEGGAQVDARSRVTTRSVHTGNRLGSNAATVTQKASEGVVRLPLGGYTPLLFAAQQGAVEIGRLLVAKGANVDDKAPSGTSAVVIAVHSGHPEFAKLLLDNGADARAADAGYSALHVAVLTADLASVRNLLGRGADPNQPMAKGSPVRRFSADLALSEQWAGATPLWLAAKFGELEIARALLSGGADPARAAPDGTTPLMIAISAGAGLDRRERYVSQPEKAALLAPEDAGRTLDLVRWLVGLGVDVNAANKAGDTALHAAAARTTLDGVVRILADAGARLDVKNAKGQTPLAVALARGDDSPKNATAVALRTLGASQ